MAELINDTLQSYAPGPGVPNQFNGFGIVFNSEFIDTGTIPSPSQAPGFYEKVGIIYALFGTISYPINALLSSIAVQQSTVYWSTLAPLGGTSSPGVFSLSNTSPTTPFNQIVLLQVSFPSDNSVSINIPGNNPFNSLIPAFLYDTWHEYSLAVTIGSVTISGVLYYTVTVSMTVDGFPILTGISAVTSIPLSASWNNAATVNQWLFTGIANGDYFSEFAITNDIQSLPWYPNLVMTRNARMSQDVVELIMQPLSRNVRMSQAITELIAQPSTRNARMSQAIVELILQGTFSAGPGFYVRES